MNEQVLSGKEDFIRQVRLDSSLLKLDIARHILGDDYDRISRDLTEQDNPDARIDYGRKLARLGYSQEQIKKMPLGEAKQILDRTQQVKTLLAMDFTPNQIHGMSDEYIEQIISLVR
jgi:hypothetical protein